jgi:DHA1 family inner membrane transport protein
MPLLVFLIAACSFVIGTGEFVIMGLLPQIAGDLGVSIASAGLLVSAYAIGIVVGAPLFTLSASALRRDHLLVSMMVLFTGGALLCGLAPSYAWLLTGRIICALAHGAFLGVAVVVAASVVKPERAGGAIGLVFAGITFASVIGVPLGTAVGQRFGWTATFDGVAAASALVTVLLAVRIPAIAGRRAEGVRGELRALLSVNVLVALSITVFVFAGIFSVFTFIAPELEAESHISPNGLSLLLLLFGVGMTIGVNVGGPLADRLPVASSIVLPVLLVAVLAAFHAAASSVVAVTGLVFLLGLFCAMMVPGLQMRVLREAGAAPTLASSVNISAFNIGNAAGAWAGSIALVQGGGLTELGTTGASFMALAALTTALGLLRSRRGRLAEAV